MFYYGFVCEYKNSPIETQAYGRNESMFLVLFLSNPSADITFFLQQQNIFKTQSSPNWN